MHLTNDQIVLWFAILFGLTVWFIFVAAVFYRLTNIDQRTKIGQWVIKRELDGVCGLILIATIYGISQKWIPAHDALFFIGGPVLTFFLSRHINRQQEKNKRILYQQNDVLDWQSDVLEKINPAEFPDKAPRAKSDNVAKDDGPGPEVGRVPAPRERDSGDFN